MCIVHSSSSSHIVVGRQCKHILLMRNNVRVCVASDKIITIMCHMNILLKLNSIVHFTRMSMGLAMDIGYCILDRCAIWQYGSDGRATCVHGRMHMGLCLCVRCGVQLTESHKWIEMEKFAARHWSVRMAVVGCFGLYHSMLVT